MWNPYSEDHNETWRRAEVDAANLLYYWLDGNRWLPTHRTSNRSLAADLLSEATAERRRGARFNSSQRSSPDSQSGTARSGGLPSRINAISGARRQMKTRTK